MSRSEQTFGNSKNASLAPNDQQQALTNHTNKRPRLILRLSSEGTNHPLCCIELPARCSACRDTPKFHKAKAQKLVAALSDRLPAKYNDNSGNLRSWTLTYA
jgi:hypothetical protein